MAALTKGRQASRAGSEPIPGKFRRKVAANVVCYQNGLAVNVAGYARPGYTATGLKVFGVFKETVDNTGGAAGALDVEVERGVFAFDNSTAGDAIAQADVGNNAYIVDDQTVAKTDGGGTRSIAGVIEGFDGTSVLVRVGA